MNKTSRKLPGAIIQEELDSFHRAFAKGNEAGLFDALRFCQEYSAPVPPWVLDAMVDRQRDITRGEYKRHGKWQRQFRQDMIDFGRAEAVEECRDHGSLWKVVYEHASKILEGTDCEGGPDTIAKSYKRFTKRVKTDPQRYYIPQYVRGPGTAKKGVTPEYLEWFLKTFPGWEHR